MGVRVGKRQVNMTVLTLEFDADALWHRGQVEGPEDDPHQVLRQRYVMRKQLSSSLIVSSPFGEDVDLVRRQSKCSCPGEVGDCPQPKARERARAPHCDEH